MGELNKVGLIPRGKGAQQLKLPGMANMSWFNAKPTHKSKEFIVCSGSFGQKTVIPHLVEANLIQGHYYARCKVCRTETSFPQTKKDELIIDEERAKILIKAFTAFSGSDTNVSANGNKCVCPNSIVFSSGCKCGGN